MKNRLAILLLALLPAFTAAAQKDFGGVARFSATVIDMGKVEAASKSPTSAANPSTSSPSPPHAAAPPPNGRGRTSLPAHPAQ